jgi:L-2-hydroxyglutarate oxidase LhgO
MDKVDITIIGAGVVGLAVAARLAKPRRSILLLEKNAGFGMETSSRNSEVIHSGIYYPNDSLKTRLCVKGNAMLYDYCQTNGIRTSNTGKIVVSCNAHETAELKKLFENGKMNGVAGLELLEKERVKSLEPDVECDMGLLVPGTGIIDTHGLMRSLFGQAQEGGATAAFNCEVTGLKKKDDGFVIGTDGSYELGSRVVVNSAGLFSHAIAAMAGIDIDKTGYRQHYCKGNYFKTSRRLNIGHLIYPVPMHDVQSLGIHLVLDLSGNAKFGPDAVYVDAVDYRVDDGRRGAFCESIKRYLPSISPGDLEPDMAGVRPKLQVEGGPFRDFVIRDEADRGLPGLINLIGIESPGLTSALAIAEHVEKLSKGYLE